MMEGQNQNDELYPIAVLIDELKVGWIVPEYNFEEATHNA